MAEHVELVEWPGLLAGSFEDRYLDLPPEVVVTTLRYHQKCLILEDENGGLKPNFIAVADRRDDPEGLVLQGNEWVIGARLADAGFFFNEDRKGSWATSCRNSGASSSTASWVRWTTRRRVSPRSLRSWRTRSVPRSIARCLRSAAGLCKADFLSNMVVEFPELQGVMGGHYLRLEGEPEELWAAVRDHYSPVGFEGAVPESETGRLIGVADRLDTVAGLFAVGEKPSGFQGPIRSSARSPGRGQDRDRGRLAARFRQPPSTAAV